MKDSELTISLPHILMWVLIPEYLIIFIKAHEWKNDLKKKNIKLGLQLLIHNAVRDAAQKTTLGH